MSETEQYERDLIDYQVSRFGVMRTYLFALAGPLLLVPIEVYIPLPHIVEELYKAVLVWSYINSGLVDYDGGRGVGRSAAALMIGIVFGVSESMLFLTNAFMIGNANALVSRFLLTVPMHGLTTLTVYAIGRRSRVSFVVAVMIAIAIHYYFNAAI